ncbi:hypothetical protein Avbf_08809, partial [Armadillidium vulgare]
MPHMYLRDISTALISEKKEEIQRVPTFILMISGLPYKFDPRVGVIVEDVKDFPNQTQIKEIICQNNYSISGKLTFK